MFEQAGGSVAGQALRATDIRACAERLVAAVIPDDRAEQVDVMSALAALSSAVAATQARATAAFADGQAVDHRAAGVREDRAERGIAQQVGLARKLSPSAARQQIGWSRILTRELPGTHAALAAGETTEWRAMIVARETAWLSQENRFEVDRLIAADLHRLGNRQVDKECRKHAYRLDPQGMADRFERDKSERRVSVRPAPGLMSYLTALVPMVQGVAMLAHLRAAADVAIGTGDSRTRDQLMADTIVERVTGQAQPDDVPITVNLVMPAGSLLGGDDEPGELECLGPIPASVARHLALGRYVDAPVWLRRLFASPTTGQLISMESRSRLFTKAQREFVMLRDGQCRTPYCDAPIRHLDHVTPFARGGKTRLDNCAGACQSCNFGKEAPDWETITLPDGTIEIVTPTGHRYRSPPRRAP